MTDDMTIDLTGLDYFTADEGIYDDSYPFEEHNRDKILTDASKLINGPRAEDYGDAYTNHQRIADGWNTIVNAALDRHGEILPSHVALMMDWVKTSRLLESIDHWDSWTDKAAYSALGAEMSQNEV